MSPKAISYRPYQKAAIDAIFNYFKEGNTGHPLVVAPTGSGKSIILAGFCAEIHKRYPAEKILILTHTKEIISQNESALLKVLPPNIVGIYSVGLGKKQTRQYTIAGIQSVYKQAEKFAAYSLIIVDEAHLIPPKGKGRYQTFIKAMSQAKVIGLTATPFRRGHGYLTENHIFDKIIYNIELQQLIDSGYLAPLTVKETDFTMDVTDLPIVGDDYSVSDLRRKFDKHELTKLIVSQLVQYKDRRKAWLVFAIDIDHAEHVAKELTNAGIMAAAVHSKLDIDRQHLLDLYKNGYIQALVNVQTLTTGFDAPHTDLLVLLRPTASPVLHVQMAGRGMRIAPGKENCLVLDYAGNTARLGPIDAVQVQKKRKKKTKGAAAITKTCPKCKEIVAARVKQCPSCYYEFPDRPNVSVIADSEHAILKGDQQKIITRDVKKVIYAMHRKAGKPPSFKITYICGPGIFYNEWVALEHKGVPRTRAERWWRRNTKQITRVPATVEEALKRTAELRVPAQIVIENIGQWPNIVRKVFNSV